MSEQRPLLRVVRGDPDEAEIAALAAVVAGLAAAQPEDTTPARRSVWSDRAALVRRPQFPGPGSWRASVLPR